MLVRDMQVVTRIVIEALSAKLRASRGSISTTSRDRWSDHCIS